MALSPPLLLIEAASFTCGCMVIGHPGHDPDRVGLVLLCVATILTLAVLLVLSPADIAIDPEALDPFGIWGAAPLIGTAARRSS